jgi:hypothetical protein
MQNPIRTVPASSLFQEPFPEWEIGIFLPDGTWLEVMLIGQTLSEAA